MEKLRSLWRLEKSGWKAWELIWLGAACAVILILSIYWGDSAMGIVSATTGVACVVCTGKGKLSAYPLGAINVLLYAIISLRARYYGEVMLNLLYYFPMEFYGFYVWSKHMNPETSEVEKRRMGRRGRLLLAAAIALGTLVYGFILGKLGGELPYVDAFSTVCSVAAMAVSVGMYMEQWAIWIAVDVVTVFMWAVAFAKGNDSVATLLMWIVYLGNAVIMYVKWQREAKRNAV